MRRKSYQLEPLSPPKYKYSFKDKTYDLSVSASLDNKLGVTRVKQKSLVLPQKIKSSSNFTLEKMITSQKMDTQIGKLLNKNVKNDLKLPALKKRSKDVVNPEDNKSVIPVLKKADNSFYQSKVAKSMSFRENSYMISLTRQHFLQTIEGLRIGKTLKLPHPTKQIKLAKKNPKLKTIFLDLDETLIHCDQLSNNYTVKLNFPIQGGNHISAGVRIRPHCNDFLRQVSSFAQIIIFTASSASYADVVLDYLDPQKKYFTHRLYRQHCTLQKGYYTKDLRCVNRRLEDSVLVDNSAYSFMLQPQNGIPVIPYYHFGKDRELIYLIDFLKEIVEYEDMRVKVKDYFFWHKYLSSEGDPKKIFIENYEKNNK